MLDVSYPGRPKEYRVVAANSQMWKIIKSACTYETVSGSPEVYISALLLLFGLRLREGSFGPVSAGLDYSDSSCWFEGNRAPRDKKVDIFYVGPTCIWVIRIVRGEDSIIWMFLIPGNAGW